MPPSMEDHTGLYIGISLPSFRYFNMQKLLYINYNNKLPVVARHFTKILGTG